MGAAYSDHDPKLADLRAPDAVTGGSEYTLREVGVIPGGPMFALEIFAGETIRIEVGDGILEAPLRHANKSNARAHGRGRSPDWKRVAEYERCIRRDAREQYKGKQTELRGLLVFVDLMLGNAYKRNGAVMRGSTRAKISDVDGVKAILDALNGVIYKDDNQIETLVARMRGREAGTIGDFVRIEVVIPTTTTEGASHEENNG